MDGSKKLPPKAPGAAATARQPSPSSTPAKAAATGGSKTSTPEKSRTPSPAAAGKKSPSPAAAAPAAAGKKSPSAASSSAAAGKASPTSGKKSPSPAAEPAAAAAATAGKKPAAAAARASPDAPPTAAKKSPSPTAAAKTPSPATSPSAPAPAAAVKAKSSATGALLAAAALSSAAAKAKMAAPPAEAAQAKKSPARMPAAGAASAAGAAAAAAPGKQSPKKVPAPGPAPPADAAAKGKLSPARQVPSKVPSKVPATAAATAAGAPQPPAAGAPPPAPAESVLPSADAPPAAAVQPPLAPATPASQVPHASGPGAGPPAGAAVAFAVPSQATDRPPAVFPGDVAAPKAPAEPWGAVPPSATTPSTRAATVQVCIAADDDVVQDWRSHRMMVEMPMNIPVRSFVERILLMKLKWASLDGIVPVAAVVKNGTPAPVPEEVLELNLTPHELGWEASTFCWVWLQKAGKHDSPQRSTKAIYKDRLKQFYLYYKPEKVFEADSILTDFDGAEELLFAKLVGQYGPEPTKGQLKRKTVQDEESGVRPDYNSRPSELASVIRDMQIQYLKDTGQYHDARPTGAAGSGAVPVPDRYKDLIMSAKSAEPSARDKGRLRIPRRGGGGGQQDGGGVDFGDMSMALQESLTSALMHQSDTLLRFQYYRKLLMFRAKRLEMRRIVGLMKGGAFLSIRKDYYHKWKTIVLTKKMRRQVLQSTEMAAKSESLVGDLSSENVFLKSEMQRLRSQVEMLDNANSKRLESLYNSSELAIGQIRILSVENQQKEELINKLEQRLLTIGNMMLTANDERDRTLALSTTQKVELERENSTLKVQLSMLEEGLKDAQEQLALLKPLPKPAACTHCPHYFELQCDIEVLHANGANLRARLEDSEHERRKQQENIKALMAQINQLREGGGGGGGGHRQHGVSPRRHSFDDAVSNDSDRETPPPPPPPDWESEDERGVTPPLPNVSLLGAAGGGIPPALQQQRQLELNLSMSSVPSNPPLGSATQQRGLPPALARPGVAAAQASLYGPAAAAAMTATPGGTHQHQQQQQQPFYGYDPHKVQPVQLSMHSFFEREAASANEKTQLAMNRQLQPRLRSSGFATTHATLQPDLTQRIAEQRRSYLDGLQNTASLPATHQTQRVKDWQGEERVGSSDTVGRRPTAAPDHARYEVGQPAVSQAEMRRNIFAYKRM